MKSNWISGKKKKREKVDLPHLGQFSWSGFFNLRHLGQIQADAQAHLEWGRKGEAQRALTREAPAGPCLPGAEETPKISCSLGKVETRDCV